MMTKIDFSKTFICDVKIDRKYKQYIKDFKDENHYENWVDWIGYRGGKVIGINYLKK